MATAKIGNTAVRETWDSGTRERSALDRVTLIKKGPRTDLETEQPPYGSETYLVGYVVETSVVRPGRGGMAELTVTLVEVDGSDVGIDAPVGSLTSTIEVDMAQVDMPLLTHPDFQGYEPEIECWRSETNALLRSGYSYHTSDNEIKELTGNAIKIATKIMRGVESYLTFVPVITRTSIYKYRPAPDNIGKRDTPPISVNGSWQYLKTCDRASQLGAKRWQRVEQWQGAKEWDADFYSS